VTAAQSRRGPAQPNTRQAGRREGSARDGRRKEPCPHELRRPRRPVRSASGYLLHRWPDGPSPSACDKSAGFQPTADHFRSIVTGRLQKPTGEGQKTDRAPSSAPSFQAPLSSSAIHRGDSRPQMWTLGAAEHTTAGRRLMPALGRATVHGRERGADGGPTPETAGGRGGISEHATQAGPRFLIAESVGGPASGDGGMNGG
jgi:hypothetical protein